MFSSETYKNRRQQLANHFQGQKGVLLFLGNDDVGMNYTANTFHFRQDSNFLYFFGVDRPGLNALIDLEDGSSIIFGREMSVEDVVWEGPQPSLKSLAAAVGVQITASNDDLEDRLKKASEANRPIHFLPPYRHANMLKLEKWLGIPTATLSEKVSEELIKAVVALRSIKGPEEVAEMEKALAITAEMHLAAMRMASEGMKEAAIAGVIKGIAKGLEGEMAYGIILTVNGQTLHNHYHGNTLKNGQLVLGDFGAENKMHYAADITRTFPVSKTFTDQQKAIYQIVLDGQLAVVDQLAPGKFYKDMHLLSAKVMAEGLKGLGLMKGDIDEAVKQGAHALFFPHGLGHMIGLDVHDMEDLGEQYVGYNGEIERSTQFGTAYLRLGRKLQPGFVLTVEPGIYFIPELIDQWKAEGKFTEFINYDALDAYRSFGGIRIEDNYLITNDGSRLLGPAIPKTIEEVEAVRQGG